MAVQAQFRQHCSDRPGNEIPSELTGLDRATPNELEFLAMVRKHLAQARVSKIDGEMTFKASLKCGGVYDKRVVVEIREK